MLIQSGSPARVLWTRSGRCLLPPPSGAPVMPFLRTLGSSGTDLPSTTLAEE